MIPGRLTTFRNDGLDFDVVDSGPLDGEPVVLLHGFPQRASSWRRVTELLHEAGFRTIAPDQRGYSRGARPKGRRAYATQRLVGDVLALLDALDAGSVHLVGHDWGAAVAWGLASRHPERVRTLTAVSVPHPAAFVRAMGSSRQLLRSWYMGAFQIPFLPEWLLSRDTPRVDGLLRGMGMDDEGVRHFRAEVARDGALPGGLGWYRSIPFSSLPGHVAVPTTMIWSAGDVALDRRGAVLSEEYVDAPFRLVEVAGSHWIPEEQPDVVADAVRTAARG